MGRLALVAAVLVLLSVAASAPALAAPSATRCSANGLMAGPYFVSKVRTRGVSCRSARALVRAWGRVRDCVQPRIGGDNVCRAGRYRCVSSVGSEDTRATCKRGTRRAVGFNYGS